MNDLFELHAEPRSDVGKGASRRLRRHLDKIPAIIYGAGKEPQSISLQHHKVLKSLENKAFFTKILTIDVGGKKEQAVLKALQRHPFKPRIQHMDFLRITGKEKIMMRIPLRFINEATAPGVKIGGGVVSRLMTDVEIMALPKDMPEVIEVDLAKLELNHSIHLSELKLPSNVTLALATHGELDAEHDQAVVSIHVPRAVTIEEGAPEAPAAPEATAVAAVKEGEEAAKGDSKKG